MYEIMNIPLPEKFSIENQTHFELKRKAKDLNLVRFIGKSCSICGGAEYYTSNGNCVICHSKNVLKRYHKDPLKIEKSRKNYDKNKDHLNSMRNEKHKNNPEHTKNITKIWRDKNPDKTQNYNLKHKAKRKELNYIWLNKNPERKSMYERIKYSNRRTRLKNIGGKVSIHYVKQLKYKQWNTCYWCLEPLTKYHLDHVIPISKGGDNSNNNLVVACPACNLQKNNKLVEEWFAMPNCRGKRR